MIQKNNRIVYHALQISDPEKSLDFYQNKLGMTLASHKERLIDDRVEHQYFLGFESASAPQTNTRLKLVYQDGVPAKVINPSPDDKDGYWKIGITLEDVDLGRESLLAAGVSVSEPRQFRDIGYLCHLADPDGHAIELLQHRFAQNHVRLKSQPEYALKSRPTFGQITLRIKNPEKSLRFYQEGLGMRLLSRQVVEPYQFTLYFLAYTDEKLPFDDIDHVGNREWLWQRPYTTLELQHIWGTESTTFAYRTGKETGFVGMGFFVKDTAKALEQCVTLGAETDNQMIADPDRYWVHLIEEGTEE